MSDTADNTTETLVDVATVEDVQRTLRELQGRSAELERELAEERARRTSLESNLDGERVARTTAEIQRDEHASRVVSEAEARWNAEKAASEAAIAARQAALNAAEEDYATHAEVGDWKAVAKAQRAIAEATTELQAQRQKLNYLETNKERMIPQAPTARRETPAPAAQPTQTHRYSRFITGPLVGGEEAFLDARPQFQTDESYRSQLFDASNFAAKRFPRGSDGYLREIERILGEERQTGGDTGRVQEQPSRPANRSASAQSADLPASRRAAPGQQPAAGANEIRLTAEEAEMAEGMYGNPNDPQWYIADRAERMRRYAENKRKIADRL